MTLGSSRDFRVADNPAQHRYNWPKAVDMKSLAALLSSVGFR
jgi:hypothetical protein